MDMSKPFGQLRLESVAAQSCNLTRRSDAMTYVDGFLAAVPAKTKADYIRFAKTAGQVFKDHGALSVVDCWGDDVPAGKVTSMPMAVKCEEGEVVAFGW